MKLQRFYCIWLLCLLGNFVCFAPNTNANVPQKPLLIFRPSALNVFLFGLPVDKSKLERILLKKPFPKQWLRGLYRSDIRILRNTLFALQGGRFRSPDLRKFFRKQRWYRSSRLAVRMHVRGWAKHNLFVFVRAERKAPKGSSQKHAPIQWIGTGLPSPSRRSRCERALLRALQRYLRKHSAHGIKFRFTSNRIARGDKYLWAYIGVQGFHVFQGKWTQMDPIGAVMRGRQCIKWKGFNMGSAGLEVGLPKRLWTVFGMRDSGLGKATGGKHQSPLKNKLSTRKPGEVHKISNLPDAKVVWIPPGTFTMGSLRRERGRRSDEGPRTQVKITQGFWMWQTEVTQAQFKAVTDRNPSYFEHCGLNCPVENVNWYEALAFANSLSRKMGLPECFDCTGKGENVSCRLKEAYQKNRNKNYLRCRGWRLPTEAEWEYAARAGTKTALYNGKIRRRRCRYDRRLDQIAWYCGNSSVSYEGCDDTSK